MSRAGHAIRLDRHMLCTHLKHWTLREIVRVDIRDRAYPWARLLLRWGDLPVDLNLQWAHRVSALLVWIAIVGAVLAVVGSHWRMPALVSLAACVGGVIWLNRRFYAWLLGRRGLWFVTRAIPLHFAYYAYASGTFVWAWIRHTVSFKS